MVCQAASQTRFMALKHENGIPAEESQMCQQFSAWNSKDSDHMKLPLDQNCSFLAFPGTKNGVAGLSQVQHPSLGLSYSPCLNNFPQHGRGVLDEPIDAPRKRFIIFDRSGNRTRFFGSPSFSRQNNIVGSEAPATTSVLCGKVVSGVEEKWGENNLSDGEGDEMLEDAEGIDALLYSDSDDEYEYDDDANDGTDTGNDEASSTRHTPLSTEDWENKGESLEKHVEQVGNGDGSPKRRKLLDGSCKKSSFGSNEEGLEKGEGASSRDCNDDVAYSSKNEKKVKKIHEALEVLGGIIPGLKSKDPLSIIEKAIAYLETMKIQAKALGVEVSD